MGKATLGPAKGAVVKLTADADVTLGLGISEGLEKSLAIMAAGWRPMWTTLGTATMANFPVIDGVETLTIFSDRGDGGQHAAVACALRWKDAGRDVEIRVLKDLGDWDYNLRDAIK